MHPTAQCIFSFKKIFIFVLMSMNIVSLSWCNFCHGKNIYATLNINLWYMNCYVLCALVNIDDAFCYCNCHQLLSKYVNCYVLCALVVLGLGPKTKIKGYKETFITYSYCLQLWASAPLSHYMGLDSEKQGLNLLT